MQREDDPEESHLDPMAELRAYVQWTPNENTPAKDDFGYNAVPLPRKLVKSLRRLPRGELPILPSSRMIDEASVRMWAAQVQRDPREGIPETWIAEAWGVAYGRGRNDFYPIKELLERIGWKRGRMSKNDPTACSWQWWPCQAGTVSIKDVSAADVSIDDLLAEDE
jgi:hypothetical protein